ncbi:MAG: hypothetical protein IT204_06050 [Fimbriimonadaceae bacterium]|nr:hypothetical protein [Fimbriimonadaceae bacterium]
MGFALALVLLLPDPLWQPLPLDGGGPLQAVVASPLDPLLLLCGGPGGRWRSVDGGRRWSPAARGSWTDAGRATADLAFHPTQREVAYAAVGCCDDRVAGDWGALLRSDDAGLSWQVASRVVRFAGRGALSQGRVLCVDPFHPDSLWAATAWDGVQVSTDRGQTWSALGLADHFLVGLGRTADGTLYAAAQPQLGRPGGLYVRRAGQTAWERRWPDSVTALAVAPSKLGRVLLASPDAGLLLTTDGGRTFVNVTPAGFGDRLRATLVAYSPTHPEVAVAAGLPKPFQTALPSCYLSLDGGRTWQPLADPRQGQVDAAGWWLGADFCGWEPRALAFDPRTPRRLWLADRANLWGTTDGAATWWSGHRGLSTATITALAPDPANPARVAVATDLGAFWADSAGVTPLGGNGTSLTQVDALTVRREPLGSVVYLARGETIWRQDRPSVWSIAGQTPGPVTALTATPAGLLAALADGPLQLSVDRGATWRPWGEPPRRGERPVNLGLPWPLGGGFQVAATPAAVWLGQADGRGWEAISADLPAVDQAGQRLPWVQQLAVGGYPATVWAVTPLGVWRTLDRGGRWERMLPRPAVLAVDRESGRLLAAPRSTWQQPARHVLLLSEDQGDSFRELGGALAMTLPIRCLASSATTPSRVWVGTQGAGLWQAAPLP